MRTYISVEFVAGIITIWFSIPLEIVAEVSQETEAEYFFLIMVDDRG